MSEQRDEALKEPHLYWLTRAITAGFLATIVMTLVLAVAYWLALVMGASGPQAPTLLRWTWALTHNHVAQDVFNSLPLALLLHFLAGIAWAVVYTALAEPYLHGSGWQKGALFSLIPWILSLVIFLPLVGAGFLGLGLGAGPLPIVGNLVLHLVYGVTLGQLSVSELSQLITTSNEARAREADRRAALSALVHARTTMAAGIIIGLILGGVCGWLLDAVFRLGLGATLSMLIGMLIGSALGVLIGSFWGLSPRET